MFTFCQNHTLLSSKLASIYSYSITFIDALDAFFERWTRQEYVNPSFLFQLFSFPPKYKFQKDTRFPRKRNPPNPQIFNSTSIPPPSVHVIDQEAS